MKARYRLVRRGSRGGAYYSVDTATGKRTSLSTTNEEEAQRLIAAKNEAQRQPVLNLQIAKAYLAGSDNGMNTRTWLQAMTELMNTKHGSNKERWQRVAKDKAIAPLLPKLIIETQAEHLLEAMRSQRPAAVFFVTLSENYAQQIWLGPNRD